ncbi:hypothetical protein G7Y79_00013g035920 [Physcia stellaris]|nr:hypothetical protein G7Y79_00013g035920 [Physcia stellaris]
MFFRHSFRRVYPLKVGFDKQTITNALYFIIFIFLITYSVFNTIYASKEQALAAQQPHKYDIQNVTVQPIGCTFPISDQYQRTPRYICYLLLVFTVIFRNHRWLAVGAAASVLTYSGVAAIHSIVLFASNQRFNPAQIKTHCESLTIPGADDPFLACAGVSDPDITVIMIIISGVMLGALPMAAWSTSFKRSARKPILIVWLLILALGHSLYWQTKSDINIHFQVCPRDTTEPLPGTNFQPSPLDQVWRDSFYSLVSMTHQSPQSPENGSLSCIYSCFATTAYVGRTVQQIGIVDYTTMAFNSQSLGKSFESVSTFFWWFYTFLALMTLYTTEKKGQLPRFVHKTVFTVHCRQQSLGLGSYINRYLTRIALTTPSSISDVQGAKMAQYPVTVLELIQLFTQTFSAVSFCLFVVIEDFCNHSVWSALERESLAAVGQWSSLVVVLMVLLAAGVSRTLGRRDATDTSIDVLGPDAEAENIETVARSSVGGKPTEGIRYHVETSEDDDVDSESEIWDWRVGYAS